MSIKKKIIKNSLVSNKPDTAMRAGITANVKFTRGKQLVEHNPFSLIADPFNPRPGEIIDEAWLKDYLYLGTEKSRCKISEETNEYVIPEYSELGCGDNETLEDSYNFLRGLAFSIRIEGLIEPIEIFLADSANDADYFVNSNLNYGYVILEGHQRRLAAMMAGVPTVTCIEITDESMLVKLKVKHRKLRRQLSENNLRKGLTVAQNFLIAQELLSESDSKALTNKELSSILGLNESIVSAIKSICVGQKKYPPIFLAMIKENKLTFKMIRFLVSKSYEDIEKALLSDAKSRPESLVKAPKPRGKQGGATKKSATFQVKNTSESFSLQRLLLSRFPEIEDIDSDDMSFKALENILNKIREMALNSMA